MLKFRKATRSDLKIVLDLIEAGFAAPRSGFDEIEGKEHRVLFSYLYSLPDWNPDWLYLAEDEEKILAAVGFFPQTLSFENLSIPVWAISPVVTVPEYRGQGIASQCIHQTNKYLKELGITAVFLWGLPSYYPKLGFVPLLPRYKTKLTGWSIQESANFTGKFKRGTVNDLKIIANLYDRFNRKLWLQPCRNLEWWQQRFDERDIELAEVKEVPFPKKENFLVWENNLGNVTGYLYYVIESGLKISIKEALAPDIPQALMMMQNFLSKYVNTDQTLFIHGTPEHPLNKAAYRLGGMHLNPAPLAGMLKVLDWSNFLSRLTPLFTERLSKITPSAELHWLWEVDDEIISIHWGKYSGFTVKVNSIKNSVNRDQSQSLTRLIFGLYDELDFQVISPEEVEFLKVLFPQKYPFIWDANYLY